MTATIKVTLNFYITADASLIIDVFIISSKLGMRNDLTTIRRLAKHFVWLIFSATWCLWGEKSWKKERKNTWLDYWLNYRQVSQPNITPCLFWPTHMSSTACVRKV